MAENPPNTAPTTREVDIDGVTVSVPADVAEKLIAKRQAFKEEHRKLSERIGAIDAERKAAEERANREAQEKEAIKLAKDGEIGKVREMLTKDLVAQHEARTKDLSAALETARKHNLSLQIGATVRAKNQHLDAESVQDIVTLISLRARPSDEDPSRVVFLDDGGKPVVDKAGAPVGPEAYVEQFLSKRKAYQPATVPNKSGSTPARNVRSGQTISKAEFDAMQPKAKGAFIADGGKVE